MVKRKKSRKNKKSSFIFFILLWKAIGFLIKLPYILFNGILRLFNRTKKEVTKKKIDIQRKSMSSVYEELKVVKTLSGDYEEWKEKISKSESTIGLILGARGTGKTAFGLKILENLYVKDLREKDNIEKQKPKKNFYAIGFKEENLPKWIISIDDVSKIKNNSFVLIDEGGILFSSRKAMTSANKILSDLILITRHKNISVIFISQNSSNLEVNAIRQADYIVLKPSSLLQKDFERKKIKDIYEEIEKNFKKFKDKKGITYIYSEEFRGFVENSLPSFWNQKISKSFERF